MPPADSARRPWWALAGHPVGVTVVILTGMWELFALMGMRTILVYYLVKELAFPEAQAIQVYSLSTAASFMMSLAGALLADRWLGLRRAVLAGALIMAAGHLALLAPHLLYVALALIVLGYGLLKPSLVALLGRLYAPDDPRRDRAFVLYKAGCGAGAIFSPIVCGWLGETYGWTWGLAVCGVGMTISAATFVAGRKHLRELADVPELQARADASPASAASLASHASLILALIACVLFATAYGQQGGTIALWIDSSVDRQIDFAGAQYTLPAAWFQALNPIVILAAAPLLHFLWARRETQPGRATQLPKMRFGALLLAIAFGSLALGSWHGQAAQVSPAWPIFGFILMAAAELYFDAIGQAFVVGRAGRKSSSTLVGVWFTVQALGFVVAGWVADVAWGSTRAAAFFALMAAISAASWVVVAVAVIVSGKYRTSARRESTHL